MQINQKRPNKNMIPDWFKLYREFNQPTDIHIFRVNQFDNNFQYIKYDHSETDGFGIAIEELSQDGWTVNLNEVKPNPYPPFYILLFSIFIYPFWSRIRQVKWRNFNLQKDKEIGPYFHHFSREETEVILRKCEGQKTNLNAYLIWTANNTVNDNLSDKSNPYNMWWIPVDMRRFIPINQNKENLTSHIAIEINPNENSQEIRRRLSKKLKRLDFLGAWWWLQIGKYIGIKGMRYILKQQLKNNRWTGSLTNMGTWPKPGFNPPDHFTYAVFGNPPAPIGHPIALGASVYAEQLYISATINSCILENEEQAKIFFDKWVRNIYHH